MRWFEAPGYIDLSKVAYIRLGPKGVELFVEMKSIPVVKYTCENSYDT